MSHCPNGHPFSNWKWLAAFSQCSCQKAGLKCTELCSCVGCRNGDVDEDEENGQNESDDEVSDDGDLEDIDDL